MSPPIAIRVRLRGHLAKFAVAARRYAAGGWSSLEAADDADPAEALDVELLADRAWARFQ